MHTTDRPINGHPATKLLYRYLAILLVAPVTDLILLSDFGFSLVVTDESRLTLNVKKSWRYF